MTIYLLRFKECGMNTFSKRCAHSVQELILPENCNGPLVNSLQDQNLFLGRHSYVLEKDSAN